jgi:3-deoxy-D-arabino-heptulosonate 7-phosphate (DAHP) synthase class II
MHVLPVGFVKIRHFGFLANANRRTLLALCRSFMLTVHTGPQILNDTQIRAMNRLCPVCKTGKLHVILRIDARVLMQLPNAVLVNTS